MTENLFKHLCINLRTAKISPVGSNICVSSVSSGNPTEASSSLIGQPLRSTSPDWRGERLRSLKYERDAFLSSLNNYLKRPPRPHK